MIAKHPQFIEALEERKKVRVKFYSVADSGVLDLVLAPMDYGPGAEAADGPHRYWLWNALADGPTRILGLAPQQIVDLQVLGETFDPSEFGAGTCRGRFAGNGASHRRARRRRRRRP